MTGPEQPSLRLRLAILIVVVACLFGALFARLWFLQVINAPKAQAVAADNGVRLIYVQAPRGRILDRNGNVLVGNVNEPVIEVDRQQATQAPDMVARLAPLLGMTDKQLRQAINNLQYSPYAPVPVMPDATPQQILYIQENQDLFPGVRATSMSVRTYSPMGKAAANIVGYVGQINSAELAKLKGQGYQAGDQIGLAGIEATYEKYLRGSPGVERVQVDSSGRVLDTLGTTQPSPGHDLKLTIDGNLQVVAQQALAQGLAAARHTFDTVTRRDFQAPAGSAVVEDPNTGQILALATDPTYDPEQFVGGISDANYKNLLNNPSDPLLDRSIQGQYAPGSTFKLVTGTAGLKYGLITPYSIFDDTGRLQIGTFPAHNDNFEAYGPIDLAQAITVSSDLYFNSVGLKLWYGRNQYGDEALQNVAREYGFGSPSGLALPNEAPGKVPTPASYLKDHQQHPNIFTESQWYPGNSDQLAIGQDELLVTPLQLANAYATFANGGTRYVPQLVQDAQTAAGQVTTAFAPKPVTNIGLQPEWRSALLAGFEGVVNNPKGTAYNVFAGTPLAGVGIAGKTGTAQVNAPRQATSVFTSFAPVSHPQYVVDAFMEDSGYGSAVAAPVVREIYDALFHFPPQPVSYTSGGSGGQN
ncbi:MAG TPA: penicillin-binding protein 2 [Acidimicrobiales bacterium]|nr:penicillin-binding protein 2 [Acidimicrobiales bacterium]